MNRPLCGRFFYEIQAAYQRTIRVLTPGIAVVVNKNIDLLTQEGYTWLLKNPKHATIEYFKGNKTYHSERNLELFDAIEKGSTISNGELFEYFNRLTS